MKVSFVILNYCTCEETIACVNSIIENVGIPEEDYFIAIVDNGSMDSSVDILKSTYKQKNIDVIFTGKNLGFACGNNYGIDYVNKNFNPEFVVVLNSDTEFLQKKFYHLIECEYRRSKFSILGPMIINADGKCDNSPWEPISKKEVLHQLNEYAKQYSLPILYLKFKRKIKALVKRIFCINEIYVDRVHIHKTFWQHHQDVEVQGACVIFHKDYFLYEKGFDSRTFLYFEEQLLYLLAKKHNLVIAYTPEILIYHKESVATNRINKSKKTRIFLKKCYVDSLKVLLESLSEKK